MPTNLYENLEFTQSVPASGQARAATYIVGIDLSLSQSNVPYIIPEAGAPSPSTTDLFVYGDTVTLTEDLLNPGANLSIAARRIVFPQGVFLDVSGTPGSGFPAGLPVEQTNHDPGAPGANGADASSGTPAGKLLLYAEEFAVSGTAKPSPQRTFSLSQALTQSFASALPSYLATPGLAALSLGPALPPLSLKLSSETLQAKLSNPVLSGLSRIAPPVVSFDGAGNPTATFTFSPLQLGATLGVGFLPFSCAITFDLSVTIAFTLNASQTALTQPQVSLGYTNTSAAITSDILGLDAPLDSQLPAYLPSALTPVLSPLFSELAQAAVAQFLPGVSSIQAPGLILLAYGGQGGRGQDGADGIQGATGPQGQNTDETVSQFSPTVPSQCYGGTGDPGGQAGSAGHSGAGGAGGTITAGSVIAAPVTIARANAGGLGGFPSFPGAAGAGGPGGQGGTYYIGFMDAPRRQMQAPSGAPGAAGAPPTFAGAVGPQGAGGSGGGATTLTYDGLAPVLNLGQLQLEQQAAKLAYLNAATQADYQDVIATFNWLYRVTGLFTQSPPPGNTGLTATDLATRAAIHAAAGVELARLARGLDYYGDLLNYAPVLTLQYFQQRVQQLVTLGQAVQQQLTVYQSEEASEQLGALQATQAHLQQDLANLQSTLQTLQGEIGTTTAQLKQLDSQIQQQQDLITATISKVQQEYTEQQADCTFSNVLTAVSSILQVARSAYTGLSDLTAALTVEQVAANALQGVDGLVQQVQVAEANYAALKSAYGAIAQDLRTNPDSALIAVDEEDFDNLIDQYYGGLPDAQALKEDVAQLIDLVRTRSQTLLNCTALYVQLAKEQAAQAQTSAELENVAALLSANNPSLPDLVAFMQQSLNSTLNSLLDNLYLENQAYEYWSLQEQPFSTANLDIGSLAGTAQQLDNGIQGYLQGTARPFARFQDQSLTIDTRTHPSAFALLPKTGKLAFTLGLDGAGPLAGYYSITAETVAISLPGVQPPPGTPSAPTLLAVNLVQCGPDVLESPDGTLWTFTHTPRAIPFQYNYTTQQLTITGQIGDPAQGFTGLSPFSTWVLDFSSPDNAWLDLTQVQAVTLTFTGQLLGAAATSQRAAAGGRR